MAIAFVKEVVAAGSSSAATTLVLTIPAATTVSVGNHLILSAVASAGVITGVTDSKGNTWQVDRTQAVDSDAQTSLASCKVTVSLTTGDTITVTFGGSSHRAASVQEWSGLATSSWFDKPASSGGTAGTAADSTATATLAQAAELVVGVVGHVSTVTAFTPEVLSPVWTQRTTAASTTTVRTVRPMTRVVAATTAVSAKATWTTARDWAALVGTYKEAAAPGTGYRHRLTMTGVG